VVILKRHACELHELGPAELSAFWSDVASVGRAVTDLFHPVKLDNLVMGHRCPHLHAHVYPQYRDDDPFALLDISAGSTRLSDSQQRDRVNAMRGALGS
jgi:diadenosine tetraphosphate (Ap4A) HIT family hydrolase